MKSNSGHLVATMLWCLVWSGCGSDPSGPEPPVPVASVSVSPDAAGLDPGATVQLTATPRSSTGVTIAGRTVAWSTDDPLVATVTAAGLVRAEGVGVAQVRATIDGRWTAATITVADPANPRPMLSRLSPASVPARTPSVTIVLSGAGFAPHAQVVWDGTVRPATAINSTELRFTVGPSDLRDERTVAIRVRNPGGAGLDSDALAFVIAEEAVDLVTVSPTNATVSVGGDVPLTARTFGADGSELYGRVFTWTSTAPATASVDHTGLVRGHRVGNVLVTVESEGRTAQARISVVTAVALVLVTPSPAAVLVGSSVQVRALTISSSGGTLSGRTVTWSSDDPGIATVDADGVVSGHAKGSTRIVATSEGVEGSTIVEVRQFAAGPVQAYELRGLRDIIFRPAVGTTTWVDPQGASHLATLFLAGGDLVLDSRTSAWTQTLRLEVAAAGVGVVGDTTWTDQGTYAFALNPDRIVFDNGRGTTFTAVNANSGEIHVQQDIGSLLNEVYRWVIY